MKIKMRLLVYFIIAIFTSQIGISIVENEVTIPKTMAAIKNRLEFDGFSTVLTNKNCKFDINGNNGEFRVISAATGTTWNSNPIGRATDDQANALGKLMMDSLLTVTFFTPQNTISESTSAAACIKKKGLGIYKIDNAIRSEYTFVNEKVMIPVEFRLNSYGLEVNILTSEIKEYGTLKVATISVLPYFSAVADDEDGYIMVPDGCGALMYLSPEKDDFRSFTYKKEVYGRDEILSLKQITTKSEDILIPAFGLKTSKKAMMGLITEGDSVSSIQIFPEGIKTGYNCISPLLTVRESDMLSLYEGSSNAISAFAFNDQPVQLNAYKIQYFFLEEDSANYSEMAKMAANYYKDTYKLNERNYDGTASVYISTLGSVKKNTNVFGIPVNKPTAVTDFEKAQKIIEQLKKEGVQKINLLYEGVFSGGTEDKYPVNANIEPVLGGQSGLKNLLRFASTQNATVFPMVDLVRIYRSGGKISKTKDSSRSIKGVYKEIYPLQISSGTPDKKTNSYSIVKSELLPQIYSRNISELKKLGIADFGDSGMNILSADYQKKYFGADEKSTGTDRVQALSYKKETMGYVHSQVNQYLVKQFYSYMLPYITNISELPIKSSGIIGITEDIPFIQMVVNRFVEYSSTPLNFQTNHDNVLLKMLEYGSMPSIYMIGIDSQTLNDTVAKYSYTGNYTDWVSKTVSMTKQFESVYNKLKNQTFIAHEKLANGIYKSTYSKGSSIYVNYSNKMIKIENSEIPAMSFFIK